MLIRIKSEDVNIRLRLPSFMIKSRLIAKGLSDKTDVEAIALRKMIKNMYGALKKYRKQHGRITLVDIESSDGETVQIVF